MKKSTKILKTVLNVIIWLFVVFSVCITVLAFAAQANADGIPALGGKAFLSVATNSMEPTIKHGDLIVGQMLTADEKASLKVKDVITFYADLDGNGTNEINSHRIASVNKNDSGEIISYVTKGDNNLGEDTEPVTLEHVICKWSGKRFAGVGSALAFLQTQRGFLIVIVLPLVLFFLYEIYSFVNTFIKIKTAGKKQITAEDEELIKQKAVEEYLRQQQESASGDSDSADAAPEEDKETVPSSDDSEK